MHVTNLRISTNGEQKEGFFYWHSQTANPSQLLSRLLPLTSTPLRNHRPPCHAPSRTIQPRRLTYNSFLSHQLWLALRHLSNPKRIRIKLLAIGFAVDVISSRLWCVNPSGARYITILTRHFLGPVQFRQLHIRLAIPQNRSLK